MIKIVKTKVELSEYLSAIKQKNISIGFIPTMGALHRGHISLVEKCKTTCGFTVASIFVNPTQFNDPKDLINYPRTLDADLALLEAAHCDLVFVPSVNEIYDNASNGNFSFGSLETVLEGTCRPGHFLGVAQVVTLLFDAVEPNYAFFGEKDFQQLVIIRAMVELQQRSINVVACATIREKDGLAMSSRNQLLSTEERAEVHAIYESLKFVVDRHREMPIEILRETAIKRIESSPLLRVEYLELADAKTLSPVSIINPNNPTRVFTAVKVGKVRLIDNMAVNYTNH